MNIFCTGRGGFRSEDRNGRSNDNRWGEDKGNGNDGFNDEWGDSGNKFSSGEDGGRGKLDGHLVLDFFIYTF